MTDPETDLGQYVYCENTDFGQYVYCENAAELATVDQYVYCEDALDITCCAFAARNVSNLFLQLMLATDVWMSR